MKRILFLIMALVLVLCSFAGCSAKAEPVGTAADEILTYRKLDPDKTTLIVSRTGNINLQGLCDAFEAANPDVQVVILDITGGSKTSMPLTDWLTGGIPVDVFFTANNLISSEDVRESCEELSLNPVVACYTKESLDSLALDGRIYMLPGPSMLNCITYNKTMFAEHGWAVPTTFDEFVALCVKIREETDGAVEGWNPNAKYNAELMCALEGFTYAELFAGGVNAQWYSELCAGTGSFSGHMEPFYAVVQTLVDNQILRPEHFTYSATTRNNEFKEGKIAMVNGVVGAFETTDFERGCFPYPGTVSDGEYLNSNMKCYVGVAKQARTDEEQDAVQRFLVYLSSADGQRVFIGDSLMSSNVIGVGLNSDERLASLSSAIDEGHIFSSLYFNQSDLGRSFSLYSSVKDITSRILSGEWSIEKFDALPYLGSGATLETKTLLDVPEAFNILETSCYIADMYRSAAGADIGLIVNNIAYRGNLMRIFAGPFTEDDLSVLQPRSFANGSTLVRAEITGSRLLDALNAPFDAGGAVDALYAFSGLVCELAPWNELGSKYISVRLPDGSELDPNKTYTVAFWSGTVSEEFLSGTPTAVDGSWVDLMRAYILQTSAAKPDISQRLTLVWPK